MIFYSDENERYGLKDLIVFLRKIEKVVQIQIQRTLMLEVELMLGVDFGAFKIILDAVNQKEKDELFFLLGDISVWESQKLAECLERIHPVRIDEC